MGGLPYAGLLAKTELVFHLAAEGCCKDKQHPHRTIEIFCITIVKFTFGVFSHLPTQQFGRIIPVSCLVLSAL